MKRMILGTDWWTDCDDAVAMRLLTRSVKAGHVELLGVGINACMEYSVASLKGFLAADGVFDVPLGLDRAATDFCEWGGGFLYQRHLAEDFCPAGSNDDAMDAVRLYRTVLANAEEKIEIAEIGFMNVIAAVLESGADDLSPKSGVELFREKVSKVWVMAGKWDEDGGSEHNFNNNARARRAAETFCRLCPVPITFLGWEIGSDVITGSRLSSGDPLLRVLCDHGSPNGRSSWDPMLVLLALIGDEERAGYSIVRGVATVDAETGENHFTPSPDGTHAYVIKKHENAYYQNAIDRMICGEEF